MDLSNAARRYRVTPEQIAAYETDGAVLLPQVADPHWIERGRAGIERAPR